MTAQIAGSIPVLADKFVITSVGVTVPLLPTDEFRLLAKDLPPIVIHNELMFPGDGSIPTLSDLGLVLLASMVLAVGLLMLRRRRAAARSA